MDMVDSHIATTEKLHEMTVRFSEQSERIAAMTAQFANREAQLRDELDDLRDELADARAPNVAKGKEAEELRQTIEALIAGEWGEGGEDDAEEMEDWGKRKLQKILDEVDARDSLDYVERIADLEAEIVRLREECDRLRDRSRELGTSAALSGRNG
jgi:seryl-tRNA synthetase